MEPEAGAQVGSDAELITRVRVGDTVAFGELYRRHVGAATALGRQVARGPAEADDLVSESFARVLDGLKSGGGPDAAFRAYLFTTLRHTAYDRTRKDSRLKFTDDMEAHETPVDAPDPVIAMAENGMVGKAFASLPERWQAVLWHTQVEGMSPAEVGVLLGMSANAVTSLAFRAREGLREAYLQAHLADTAQEQCRWTTDRLGAWARGGLSKREQTIVDAHLENCDHCAALAAELTEINSSLRSVLAPLLLGGLAAGYLAALGPVGVLTQAGVMFGTGSAVGTASAGPTIAAAAGAAGGAHAAGGVSWFSRPWAAVGTGMAAAVVAATIAVIIATSGGSSPTNSADIGAGTTAVSTGVAGGPGTGGSGGSAGTGANGSGANGSGANGSGADGTSASGTAASSTAANGTDDSNGNARTEGAQGNQTGSSDQPSPTGQPGPTDQPGSGNGLPGDTTTPPDQVGPPTSDPNLIPVPLVPTTSTNAQGSTQQPTSGSPQQQQPSAPLTRTSSPTSAPAPTQVPTSLSTPRPTTRTTGPTTPTTRPTSPTTTSTTPTTAGSPNVSISVGAFSALAGGSIDVQVDADNSRGNGTSAGGTVVVSAPGVTLGASASGLRSRTGVAFAPAVAIVGCSVAVEATSCSLPAVRAGQALHTSFILTVGVDAEPGSLVVSWGEFSKTVDFGIEPGITGLVVIDGPDRLTVGRPTPIVLAPTVGDRVTALGPITMPIRSGGIWVTEYPDTCTETDGRLTCQPSDEGSARTYGPITITVMPDVTAEDALEVEVPHGAVPIAIVGRRASTEVELPDPNEPGGPVQLSGHFSATTVTTATLACPNPKSTDRRSCGMQPVDAVKTVTVPSRATVVWARLTWVAGTLKDPSTVPDLYVDGSIQPDALDHSTRIPCSLSCPLVSYKDVTSSLTSGGKVQVKGIGAVREETAGRPLPLEGWTLTVAYTDPGSNVLIEYRNELTPSNSARGGAVTELAPAGHALVSIDAAGWAFDPVAEKTVTTLVGEGRPATTLINGLDGRSSCADTIASTCNLSGVQPIQVTAKMLSEEQNRAVGLVNTQVDNTIDALWIGTTVVVRSVPDSQPPAS